MGDKIYFLVCIFCCFFVKDVVGNTGHVNIELEILQFDNPTGTSYNHYDLTSKRKCCDADSRTENCPAQCDTSFVICLGGLTHGRCAGPLYISPSSRLDNKNSYSTSPDDRIVFTFVWDTAPTGPVDFAVNLMDYDSSNQQDLIDNFTFTTSLNNSLSYELSKGQVFSMQNYASLDIAIRSWCQDGYSGQTCDQKTQPFDNFHVADSHGVALIPTCTNQDILSIQYTTHTVNTDYTASDKLKRLVDFISNEICQNATSMKVNTVRFSVQRSIEYTASCDGNDIDAFLLTTRLYIMELARKQDLQNYFPGIIVPNVTKRISSGSRLYMMLEVVSYEDSSGSCVSQSCNVQIHVCTKHISSGCTEILMIQTTLIGHNLTICDGEAISGASYKYLIGSRTWPVISTDVKYSGKVTLSRHNIAIDPSYKASAAYGNSTVQRMTLADSSHRLGIKFLIWCAVGYYGNQCQHRCTASGNRMCDENGKTVCRPGYHGSSCTDINECSQSICGNGATCQNSQGSFKCICTPGWAGPTCEVDIDECTLDVCGYAGQSCTNNPGSYSCTCKRHGYSFNNCLDRNECQARPCRNNGTCYNTYGQYNCQCKDGFTGRRCEADIDECHLQVCGSNSMSCENVPGGFNCNCSQGWSGKTCQEDIDECVTKPCEYGICNNTPGNYTCSCFLGATGEYCHDLNECTRGHNPCHNNGTCVNLPPPQRMRCECPPGLDPKTRCIHDIDECTTIRPCVHGSCANIDRSYDCTCTKGWSGKNCSVDINECQTLRPCVHGSCTNQAGSYRCTCNTGWNGKNCSEDVNECNQHDICHNHGKCTNTVGGYTCTCQHGWSGNTCQIDINECRPHNPCLHNGQCINNNGGFECVCPSNWTGDKCQTVNECTNNPCVNNGTCLNLSGSYNCTCAEGWTGSNCEVDIDECTSSMICMNNGTCINLSGSYNCTCTDGWTGSNCEVDVDECTSSMTCMNNGTCINLSGSYNCTCTDGWTGSNCEVDVDECTSSMTCMNNGTCINLSGSYNCTCTDGWTGSNCEVDVDECTSSMTCMNNGTCINLSGSYNCTCTDGWTGSNCEVDVDECTSSMTCLNNGTCINLSGSYNCTCSEGWTGSNCEVDIDECTSSMICMNNGTCINTVGGYTCRCMSGWTGLTCDVDFDECLYDPCDNGGTCINTQGSYHCQCNTAWSGINCSDSKQGINASSSTPIVSSTSFTQVTAPKPISAGNSTLCTEMPCQNNGTCIDFDFDYTCNCSKHWTGENCTIDVDECVNSPCSGNSVCVNTVGSFSCLHLSDAIHPACSASSWNITINMTILTEMYPSITTNHVFFGDNSCQGTETGSLLTFQQGLHQCLTSKRVSDGTIFYENILYYAIYDPINPFIIRQHKWTYTVECDISKNEAISTHVHHETNSGHATVVGHYQINMAFFSDPNFMTEIPGNPIHANIGDDVYVKVFTNEPDWTVKMRLHTCYTKPDDNADDKMIYYIIKDGCEVDSNTHIMSQSTHETKFVFQDFEYTSNREGLNIYCNATFCETKDFSPGCTQACGNFGGQALIGK